MTWTKLTIKRINDIPLTDVLPGCDGVGTNIWCRCPKCGAEGKEKGKRKGLRVSVDPVKGKNAAYCNSCNSGFAGAISALQAVRKCTFREAVVDLANQSGIQLEEVQEEEEKPAKKVRRSIPESSSFVTKQLAASGLTYEDVMAQVIVDGHEVVISPFTKGSLDINTGRVDECADEMLILYYDLEGRRKMFVPARNKSREMPYTRVRWSNREPKYQTCAGAKSEFYYPDKIRKMYKDRIQFDTLFVQEGEKKAEKACKHGINSIAIQGIGNIGRIDDGLSPEIQYLVQRCGIKNIVLLMDSDWSDLKSNLKEDDRVDVRPLSFARALIKFKKFVGTLSQCNLHIDIWFSHINKNQAGDKGIDDLLTNSLCGKESELLDDISNAMTDVGGKGSHIDVINVSSWSDTKIMSLWNLNNNKDFIEQHEARLKLLKSFKLGNVFYKTEDGEIKIATEFGSGKEFWSVSFDEKGKKKIEMDSIDTLSWLTQNGFRNRKRDDGTRDFVKIEEGIIRERDEFDIKNFVLSFVYKATKDHSVHNFFSENIDSKLSKGKLCQLEELVTSAGIPEPNCQHIYFRNRQVKIDESTIEVEQLTGPVYEKNVIKRDFERVRIFEYFVKNEDGSFDYRLTPEGQQCEFFRYILNTSNFWGVNILNREQITEQKSHVANKITCIGYLLRDFKYMTEAKAVVAMDATMAEVGDSHGRSGKSLIGVALKQFVSQKFIGARNLKNDDNFTLSEVERTHKNIFLDDIEKNFDFGRWYPNITGDLSVNVKGGGRFTIPFEEAPKFYITTNHALSNIDDSARARLTFVAFSNWYNVNHTPDEEFGHMFFGEWDEYQWSLFDNLMIECIQIYMIARENSWNGRKAGLIDPPMEDLEKRRLRQEMGEEFLQWAEVYFEPSGNNINQRRARNEIYSAYINEYGIKASLVTSKAFSSKLKTYCIYKGLHFNPTRKNKEGQQFHEFFNSNPGESFIGGRDLASSSEFFTIASLEAIIQGEVDNIK